MNNVKLIRERGYKGDVVARMTVSVEQDTCIYDEVMCMLFSSSLMPSPHQCWIRPRSLAARLQLGYPRLCPYSRLEGVERQQVQSRYGSVIALICRHHQARQGVHREHS